MLSFHLFLSNLGPIHDENYQSQQPKVHSTAYPQCNNGIRATFDPSNTDQQYHRQEAERTEIIGIEENTRKHTGTHDPITTGTHWLPLGSQRSRPFEPRFKCNFCEATFAFRSKLKIHETKHTGERKYHCEICGKKFAQLSNKMTHYSIHTGARPFQCGYCKKTFRLQSALTVHNRIHTGERPFVCPTCGSAFKQQGHLREHRKTHLKS